MARVDEPVDDMRADEPGTAGYKDHPATVRKYRSVVTGFTHLFRYS
jgi:hypothetical protein